MTRLAASPSSVPRALVVALLAAASACGAPLFVPPAGPGEPAPDAAAAWADASAPCHRAPSIIATLDVSGRIAGQRLPHLHVATGATPDAMRLEGSAGSVSVFKLAGTTDHAQLHLDDGNRLVTAGAGQIVDALIGAALPPARWFALVTGCFTTDPAMASSARFGPRVSVTTPDGRVFLEQRDGRWRIAHVVFGDLTVTVSHVDAAGVADDWTLAGLPGRTPALSLHVVVRHASDAPIDAARAFTLAGVLDASPMSLDELRQSGPLRRSGG